MALLRIAHQRAAPIRLTIGFIVTITWLVFGGAAAIDYAARSFSDPSAQLAAVKVQPNAPLYERFLRAGANGVCVFMKGDDCDYKEREFGVVAGQTSLTTLAVVTLFFGFWRQLFASAARAFRAIGARHVIITGEGPQAEALARAVVRKRGNRRPRAAVLVRRNGSSEEVESLGADGVSLMVGDPADPAVLKAAGASNAYRIVMLSAHDAENLAAAAALRKVRKGLAPGDVAVRLESPTLRRDLPSRSGIGAADFFSLSEISARLLLRTELFLEDVDARAEAKGVHVAIIGWDDHAEAIAERVFRLMWAPGFQAPRVTVFTQDVNAAHDAFQSRFPNALQDPGAPAGKAPVWTADIAFRPLNWRAHGNPWSVLASAESERGAISSVVITFPDDQETLHCAAVMAGRAEDDCPRLYVRDDQDSTIGAVLSAYQGVIPFAEYSAVLSPMALVDRSLDHAARKIHEVYITARVLEKNSDAYEAALRKGSTPYQRLRRLVHWSVASDDLYDLEKDFQDMFGLPALNKLRTRLTEKLLAAGMFAPETPAQCLWDDLQEHYIETNRVAADHALLKLRSLGWTPGPHKGAGVLPRVKSEQISDEAAQVEHLRWCADKLLSGWQYGDARSDKLMIHTDLKHYSDFPAEKIESAIQKDREMWLAAPEVASWIYPDLFVPRQADAAAPL